MPAQDPPPRPAVAPSRTVSQPASLNIGSGHSAEVRCRCDKPAGERTVVKEGPNKGRRFWTCVNTGQCGFFEWMDGPSSGSSLMRNNSLAPPPIQKAPAGRSVSAIHDLCSMPFTDFVFLKYSDTSVARNKDDQNLRRCKCDLTAVQKTVVKEGPNQGRKFWVCPNCEKARCGYFEWDDNPAPTPESSTNVNQVSHSSTSNSAQQGECYKVR